MLILVESDPPTRRGFRGGAQLTYASLVHSISRHGYGMRASLLVLLLCLLIAFASCSPIHGIWNNLPMASPGKRMYGLYHHLPMMETELDKRNVYFWRPIEVLVD